MNSRQRTIFLLRITGAVLLVLGVVLVGYVYHQRQVAEQLRRDRAKLKDQNEAIQKRTQRRLDALKSGVSKLQETYQRVLDATGVDKATLPEPPKDLRVRLGGQAYPHDTYRTFISRLNNQRRRASELNEFVRHRRVIMQFIPSRIPVRGWLSSGFGPRTAPMGGRGDGYHTGVDLASWLDRPVWAPASGKVVETGYNGLYGHYVVLKHRFGYRTKLAHLRSIAVQDGQPIRRGDVVGRVGSTGHSTGAHLHYEIMINGEPVNPAPYLLALPTTARSTD